MRKIVVYELLSLDGVAEDPDGFFTDWDEASCTQLVYLYTEVARNFGGDARRFFEITSKPRGKTFDGTLSIASIDVGGGTTDLIINSYRLEGAGTSVTLFPEQKFREGFNDPDGYARLVERLHAHRIEDGTRRRLAVLWRERTGPPVPVQGQDRAARRAHRLPALNGRRTRQPHPHRPCAAHRRVDRDRGMW